MEESPDISFLLAPFQFGRVDKITGLGFFFGLVSQDRVSLCSPGCSGTACLCLQVLGLKVCTTTTWLGLDILPRYYLFIYLFIETMNSPGG